MSSSIFFLVAAGVAFLSRAGAPIFSVHIRCDADTLSLDATPLSKASRASGSHEGGYRAQLRSADAESKSTPVGFEPTRGDPIGLAGRRLSRSAKVSLPAEAASPQYVRGFYRARSGR